MSSFSAVPTVEDDHGEDDEDEMTRDGAEGTQVSAVSLDRQRGRAGYPVDGSPIARRKLHDADAGSTVSNGPVQYVNQRSDEFTLQQARQGRRSAALVADSLFVHLTILRRRAEQNSTAASASADAASSQHSPRVVDPSHGIFAQVTAGLQQQMRAPSHPLATASSCGSEPSTGAATANAGPGTTAVPAEADMLQLPDVELCGVTSTLDVRTLGCLRDAISDAVSEAADLPAANVAAILLTFAPPATAGHASVVLPLSAARDVHDVIGAARIDAVIQLVRGVPLPALRVSAEAAAKAAAAAAAARRAAADPHDFDSVLEETGAARGGLSGVVGAGGPAHAGSVLRAAAADASAEDAAEYVRQVTAEAAAAAQAAMRTAEAVKERRLPAPLRRLPGARDRGAAAAESTSPDRAAGAAALAAILSMEPSTQLDAFDFDGAASDLAARTVPSSQVPNLSNDHYSVLTNSRKPTNPTMRVAWEADGSDVGSSASYSSSNASSGAGTNAPSRSCAASQSVSASASGADPAADAKVVAMKQLWIKNERRRARGVPSTVCEAPEEEQENADEEDADEDGEEDEDEADGEQDEEDDDGEPK